MSQSYCRAPSVLSVWIWEWTQSSEDPRPRILDGPEGRVDILQTE